MDDWKLGAVESRFADILWQRAPLSSGELVKICERELSWKKSTTYTVLKKLCERGLFQNKDGLVSVCIGREEFYARQSEQVVEESFDGSLPAFVAAFTRRKKLSEEEVAAILQMIEGGGGEG
ncbi:MAG: BlaI/MecI/CopY family transcriptional regulator [Ruminococcaceae bacterium]|nr:BlaI/MecI/CopY family transcriptional regulator [Oscillospiraceae bacterium]